MAMRRCVGVSSLVVTGLAASAGDLNFLVMGDWGGTDHGSQTTDGEVATAKSMNAAAEQLGAKFALALGDNFYHYGVDSVDDSRFQTTFEECFAGDHLSSNSGFKFHVIAGNHDHRGNVQAQIDYTAKSERWNFPNYYYSFVETAPDGATVEFVMIDSVVHAGNSQLTDAHESLLGSELLGPADLHAAASQIDWIEQTLAASTADYIIVSGHYPVHSAAEHGPSNYMQPDKFPFLTDHRVSAYLCGHDHNAQYIDVGDGVQYHVIGSASHGTDLWVHKYKYSNGELKFHATPNGGFAIVSANKTGMQIRHIDPSGAELHAAPVIAPRGPNPPKGKWDCHTNNKVKVGKDKNLDGKAHIYACEDECLKREDCHAIMWHRWDSHCHIYTGDFSHEDFLKGLENDDHDAISPNTHDSCFYIPPAVPSFVV